jgi:hypothetical protein
VARANGHEPRAPGRRRRDITFQQIHTYEIAENRLSASRLHYFARLLKVPLPIADQFLWWAGQIVAQLKQCREQIGAGIVDLSFQIPGSEDPTELMKALELFGKKVLPHIRDT